MVLTEVEATRSSKAYTILTVCLGAGISLPLFSEVVSQAAQYNTREASLGRQQRHPGRCYRYGEAEDGGIALQSPSSGSLWAPVFQSMRGVPGFTCAVPWLSQLPGTLANGGREDGDESY